MKRNRAPWIGAVLIGLPALVLAACAVVPAYPEGPYGPRYGYPGYSYHRGPYYHRYWYEAP